jgi:hypothetical protein
MYEYSKLGVDMQLPVKRPFPEDKQNNQPNFSDQDSVKKRI